MRGKKEKRKEKEKGEEEEKGGKGGCTAVDQSPGYFDLRFLC